MTPLDIAKKYIARDWAVIPIPHGEKGPKIKGWDQLKITPENVAQYFNSGPQNIGVQMGPKSGGLADVDLDCPEAVRLAHYFLPETGAVFGRPSKPSSHHEYLVTDPKPVSVIAHRDDNQAVILELRIGVTGAAQTVFPGSRHVSGEMIEWVRNGAPANVPFKALARAVRGIAVASLLLRHWHHDGAHDMALRIGGFLARAGATQEDIGKIVTIVAHEAGGSAGAVKNHSRTAKDAADAYAEGKPTYGLPALRECLGEKGANALARILDYRGDNILDPTDPMRSAREIVVNNFTKDGTQTLHRHRGAFWEWTGNHFHLVDDETIRAGIWAFLEQAKRLEKVKDLSTGKDLSPVQWQTVPFKPTRTRVGDVFDALGAVTQLDKIH